MEIPSIPPPETSSESSGQFRQKIQFMYYDLGNRGVWRSTMAPPIYKLAWLTGFQLVPPLFAKFRQLAAFQGSAWGVLWAFVMYLESGGRADLNALLELGNFSGVFFGLFMAVYFKVRAGMLNLPSWDVYGYA